MKTLNDLKHGECTVVAEFEGKRKEFKGSYHEKLNIVFMAIPNHYKIIGYIQ